MSIWIKVAEGRFYSMDDGQERKHILELQNWGLQVSDLFGALVVTGRSASTARVRLAYNEGATPDLNALIATTDIIGLTTVSGSLPQGSTIGGRSSRGRIPADAHSA